MKKTLKKYLSILLAASLLTVVLPVQNAIAAETNSSSESEVTPVIRQIKVSLLLMEKHII